MSSTVILVGLLGLVGGLAIGGALGFLSASRRPAGPVGDPDTLAAVDRAVHHQVRAHAAVLQQDLRHVGDLVGALRRERAEQDGRLVAGLEQTLESTRTLSRTAGNLEAALASPSRRGQWGERLADDVLAAAGFVEGVTHHRQRRTASGTIPDYTFLLPRGHVVHMDVKFPIDNYLRWLDATPNEQPELEKRFRVDVRQRIDELGGRGYVDPACTLDRVLLFVPNESVFGFMHEHDPALLDHALARRVVLCSPTTLFAVLAVIRRAVDDFLVERRGDEILAGVAGVREQWRRHGEAVEKVARSLATAQRAVEELSGPRSRRFEAQLATLEGARDLRLESGEVD